MAFNANGSAQRRNNPFSRTGSPSAAPTPGNRPKSDLFSSPAPHPGTATPTSHGRAQSGSSFGATLVAPGSAPRHHRADSKSGTPTSNTFAPSFIKTDEVRRPQDAVKGIEGENDFSGKRYVWLKDPQQAFIKAWVVEDLKDGRIRVQTDDGTVSGPLVHFPR